MLSDDEPFLECCLFYFISDVFSKFISEDLFFLFDVITDLFDC